MVKCTLCSRRSSHTISYLLVSRKIRTMDATVSRLRFGCTRSPASLYDSPWFMTWSIIVALISSVTLALALLWAPTHILTPLPLPCPCTTPLSCPCPCTTPLPYPGTCLPLPYPCPCTTPLPYPGTCLPLLCAGLNTWVCFLYGNQL